MANKSVKIRENDVEAIFEEMDTVYASSRRIRTGECRWSTAIRQGSYPLSGVDPGIIKCLKTLSLQTVVYINQRDIVEETKIAVLGATIVDERYQGENPMGTHIMIGGVLLV